MISSIELKNEASYDATGQRMDGLKQVNFIFGSNGTGKTTISRVIANPEKYADSSVLWDGGAKLDVRAYNQYFVKANFHQTNELKGIFTLGEESSELVKDVGDAKSQLETIDADLRKLNASLYGADGFSGKKTERDQLADEFSQTCWEYKKKYEITFRQALIGTMGKKAEFAARLRKEAQDKSAELKTLEELTARAQSIYADDLEKLPQLEVPNIDNIITLEANPILSKKIVGKDDVDIAAMIKKLGNSDWVREGVHFHENNDNTCPFCQQKTSEAFAISLTEYFDEAFIKDLDAIKTLKHSYIGYATQLKDAYGELYRNKTPHIDLVQFKAQLDLLVEKISTNINHLERKTSEPSSIVILETLRNVLDALNGHVSDADKKITHHNKLVENNDTERTRLQKEIWRFIVDEAQAHIDLHNQKARAIEQAIESLTKQIETRGQEYAQKAEELNKLERQGTSIQSTVAEINKTLTNYGFKGFSLAVADKAGYYKIVRPDGEDAHDNLSEGERTFVTFLYFYHWLKGSLSQSGVTANRIAVIDDPVSSLDSEILFIVSTLIKNIIASIAAGGPVKQLFLMTHNMYFFKEVSFISNKKKREKGTLKSMPTFWIVTKRGETSKIERHDKNPIKSAYQMLWGEVKNPDNSRHTIRNTLRRILEYYFNTIGSTSLDDLPSLFPADEQSICRSLISWMHEGSHFTDDDYTVVPSVETVDRQIAVFKRIFEETKHIEHFNMMMGEEIIKPLPTGND